MYDKCLCTYVNTDSLVWLKNNQTVSWFYFSWFKFQSLVNTDFEGSWTQLTQSFKVIRLSLQFYFPLWGCNLGVILTLIDQSSSAFESLDPKVISLTATFSSSGYQKKHSWNHPDSSTITRETSNVYVYITLVNCDFTLPNLSLEVIRDTTVHIIVRYNNATQSFPYQLSEIK